jgi:hypothetical protein
VERHVLPWKVNNILSDHMKNYVAYSTIIRTLLALHEGSRLLLWNNRYYLLSCPPARLTEKIIAGLRSKNWLSEPKNVGKGIAELRLTPDAHSYAEYLLHQQPPSTSTKTRAGALVNSTAQPRRSAGQHLRPQRRDKTAP